jgi:hypothetical protein
MKMTKSMIRCSGMLVIWVFGVWYVAQCRQNSRGRLRQMERFCLQIVVLIFLLANFLTSARAEPFDFKHQLFDPPSSLTISIQSIDTDTGHVIVNGVDTQGPQIPFTWDWGDGQVTSGFFPRQHTYSNLTKNYIITTTSHYSDGGTDTAQTLARFVAPQISPITFHSEINVTIPDDDVSLTSRMPGYKPSATLTHFDDSFFTTVSRSTIEYVLTATAYIQEDFVNYNIPHVNGGFQQVVLRHPGFGGMYSLWYTSPVSFGAGDYAFQDTIEYSSLMHEMGHNFTLNTPADYYYGGKIDGPANAIFSESMAQIFQHATAYEIINNAEFYGLGESIVFDIKNSANSSIELVRNAYEDYVNNGANFSSWNLGGTPDDETFGTFMTIAYKFFEQAEISNQGYRIPLKRMLKLLQLFDENLANSYDRLNNNTQADAFRATLMVAAISHAFSSDLRSDFETLNFPVDDSTYSELITAAPPLPPPPPPTPGTNPLSDALDTALIFTMGGNADWLSQTETYYHDGDAAQSGSITNDQESYLQTKVNGAGTVSFYWKVSSEGSCDYLEFYIDGVRQDRISDSEDWHNMTYEVTGSALHTLEWRYVKDESIDRGDDCGWVDKVVWTPAP